jgi:transposase-like protein
LSCPTFVGRSFIEWRRPKLSGKYRAFTREFKAGVAQRILNGGSVSGLRQELQTKRGVLYRWRDAYRKDAAGLQRSPGRPPGVQNSRRPAASSEAAAARRVAELERKIAGRPWISVLLRGAFKRVKESRRKNALENPRFHTCG